MEDLSRQGPVAGGLKPQHRRRRFTSTALLLALQGSAACFVLLPGWPSERPRLGGHVPRALRSTFTAGGLSTTALHAPPASGVRCGQGSGRLLPRRALKVNEEEYIDVWDQTTQELALDVRELLVTDANVFFIGPDIESYQDSIAQVAALLNYTYLPFMYKDLMNATETVDRLELIYTIPPLVSIQRWPWAIMMQGLVVWVDPDGNKHLNAMERDKVNKMKFPKKKAPFGPSKAPTFSLDAPKREPPADPLDMWNEADVHVDLRSKQDLPPEKVILASMINAILASPPKWRGWMKQAKIRGTVPADYQTPLEHRRHFHGHGISPRLNRLLTER